MNGNWDYEKFIGRQLNFLTVGIIGYGRFGTVLADLLSTKYNVLVTDSNQDIGVDVEFSSLDEILDSQIEFFIHKVFFLKCNFF